MSPKGMDCADDFRVDSDQRTNCVDDLWVGSDAVSSMILGISCRTDFNDNFCVTSKLVFTNVLCY
jgi:hypothetical protein